MLRCISNTLRQLTPSPFPISFRPQISMYISESIFPACPGPWLSLATPMQPLGKLRHRARKGVGSRARNRTQEPPALASGLGSSREGLRLPAAAWRGRGYIPKPQRKAAPCCFQRGFSRGEDPWRVWMYQSQTPQRGEGGQNTWCGGDGRSVFQRAKNNLSPSPTAVP